MYNPSLAVSDQDTGRNDRNPTKSAPTPTDRPTVCACVWGRGRF